MLEVVIREFLFPDDYARLVEIWKASGPGVNFARSDTPEEIQKKLNYSPDLFLVAEVSNSIIGSVIGGFDGRRGMVYHLAVEPNMRKQGVGKALMAEVETRLKAKGCIKSYLMIMPENPSVIDYYKELGWYKMDVFIMGKEFD